MRVYFSLQCKDHMNLYEFEHYDVSKFEKNGMELRRFVRSFMKHSTDNSINLSLWNVSNIDSMKGLFRNFFSVEYINITGWNTSNVHDMSFMFLGCDKLKDVIGLSDLDTSKVQNMSYMFAGCSNIVNIDIHKWNTRSVFTMCSMFSCCHKLTHINLTGLNVSGVENMSGMFESCKSLEELTLNMSKTSSLENIELMFRNCSNLKKLNISSTFELSHLKMLYQTFHNCKALEEFTFDAKSCDFQYKYFICEIISSCPNIDYFRHVLPYIEMRRF